MIAEKRLDNKDKSSSIRCPCCGSYIENNARISAFSYSPDFYELRYPLNGILGLSKVLLDENEILTDAQRKNLEAIKHGTQYILNAITNMIDIIRLGQGSITLQFDTVNLIEIIDEVVSRVQIGLIDKSIQLNKEVNDMLNIQAHKIYIRNILYNLLLQAIEFTNDGEIILRAKQVEIEQQQTIQLIIVDPNNNKIVNYKNRDNSLGYVLSKLLVELHGGHLWVETKDNIGVATHFTLPMRQ